MPVMDEFREEREALKNGTFEQKFQYFLDYYKWYVIIGVIALIMAISFIHDVVTNKDYAFFAAFVNTVEEPTAEAFWADFSNYLGIDTKKYTTGADTSMYINADTSDINSMESLQKMTVQVAAGRYDAIAGDAASFLNYTSAESYFDLREILTEEQLKKYSPYFFYVDMDVVRTLAEEIEDFERYDIEQYDPRNPKTMSDPVPIAVYIQDCTNIQNAYAFREGDVVMGILVNTSHLEEALAFLEYIFE